MVKFSKGMQPGDWEVGVKRIWNYSAAMCLGIMLVTSTGMAHADWQKTRWGMSEAQVIASVPGARSITAEEAKGQAINETEFPKVSADYASGDLQFLARFYFKKGLSLIKLQLLNPTKCADLIGALRLRYGNPAHQSSTDVVRFLTWRTERDQIGVVEIGSSIKPSSCGLSYQPRLTDRTKGL